MTYSFNILDWCALAPGLCSIEQWQDWSTHPETDWSGTLPKTQHIPMMTARRMSTASRLSVEVGLTLLNQQPDAAIFISRHGELERTCKIIEGLCQQQDISPTDFAMSVHNTASGLLTITGKQPLPITSIAAGIDGFQQGMLEAQAMLADGAEKVLLVDFDGAVPDAYQTRIVHRIPAYAIGLLIAEGGNLCCQQIDKNVSRLPLETTVPALPQSVTFMQHWLAKDPQFTLQGMRSDWQWHQ
ncbi:beta-ketoacyl synthase chain length factor [Budviciaceae bacterium BWR-B9]|uniref:Beta-ketoacyl synthase chain length factor n=1 Tax=Limnobaculum allomyrinae TaxID=2791986 RepID=A0ABS1IPS4_9GAMM|nr:MULTISPECIES: beta-ketoacyl synthase chain length factor [Limnobaculum]MBK5143766.1 beta-ketoacyl synthase chain length factor [Limnobaculum allomyrinae]MBV7693505.1 beta-ketoacyl synthase chain length factor [Limnobaculum sp. M2-1]